MSLQIMSHNLDRKDKFSGQTSGLSVIVLRDHRQPILEVLERSVLLTFR